ncbi:unnamed protein product [Caenorhabditis angaria]|uniref:DUF38 domain-containing protein n=1 Tax=Caenorhabditis angaria TaxID=860376 RepID=A0A9P1IF09_9PELO|nr:unnamed protein product [Caenorhabditis angaria]
MLLATLLFSLIPQIIPEQVPPFLTHHEAQYVAFTLIRAIVSEGPTVEKLGRVFKDPFLVAGLPTKVEEFVEYTKAKNQFRKQHQNVSDELIRQRSEEDLELFEDRKAILYYRTKQHNPQKFEKVYNEQDKASFENWAKQHSSKTLMLNSENKQFLSENFHEIERNFGSFNFTFRFLEYSDVYKVVEFEKSFYIEEIRYAKDDNEKFL